MAEVKKEEKKIFLVNLKKQLMIKKSNCILSDTDKSDRSCVVRRNFNFELC